MSNCPRPPVCSRTWTPDRTLDVSVLAALSKLLATTSAAWDTMQRNASFLSFFLFFFPLESLHSLWILFSSLLHHSLITEGITFIFNELQSAELHFLLEPLSPHQPRCITAYHSPLVKLVKLARFQ